MSRGFHFWESQPLMRQSYAPMADNPFLPAMNPQSNGTYHIDLSVEKYRRKGGAKE